MTQQHFQSLPSSLSVKGQHHLLLRRGMAYLLPLSLLSSGVALGDSPQTQAVEPLPSFNESQSSSSTLESPEALSNEEEKPALPDYESVPSMELKEESNSQTEEDKVVESNPKNEQNETNVAASKAKKEKKTALEPIAPLTNSSETPEVETSTSPQPESPKQPEVNTSESSGEETKPQSEEENQDSPSSATQNYVDLNGSPQTGEETLPDPRVEISDRENNCTTVIENGELVSGSCNLSQEETATAPQELPSLPTDFKQPTTASEAKQQEVHSTYTPPEDLPQLKLADNGDTNLIFPLSQAASVSSPFGWRNHPIQGHHHFHTGTDFAARKGTLVVAARSGKVAFTDYRGGYGLIVGLRHDDGKHESRYAHLSQIHVQPGEWVEQGRVIGRVGSTGNSSGSHLHFEWRLRKGHRWVAVDATDPLLVARDNINSHQIAFNDAGVGYSQETSNNFFASLPERLSSVSREPASWMSMPKLDFLGDTDFDRAHERKAPLANFSQLRDSVLVLPISLPQVLASLFNWQPPQLFAQENIDKVPTPTASKNPELAYRYPNRDANSREGLNPTSNLESLSDLDSLGGQNFLPSDSKNPEALSRKIKANP